MREANYLRSLSKKWWFSYLFLLMVATGGYEWLDSSGTYTFHADFEVTSPAKLKTSLVTNPYNSPVNPFKLSKTYTHISLKKVAARLTLHDLTSEAPFRSNKEIFNIYDLHKAKKELTSFLNNDEKTVLAESKMMASVMRGFGYDIPSIKKNLKVKWNDETETVSISFTSENPFLSSFVVNDLGREFARLDHQLRHTYSKTAIELFMANSHRLEVRWAGELPEAASISEIEGKKYWLSAHFPSLGFWLREGESLPPAMLDEILRLEAQQKEYLHGRLKTLSKVRKWVSGLEKNNGKYNVRQQRIIRQKILNYKIKLEHINLEIHSIDQQLRHYYEKLPTNIKNDDWILIDEEASTNYITTNYLQNLIQTTQVVSELNQVQTRFSIVSQTNYLSKMPNLLVYFWMMLFSVLGLFFMEIVYDKLRLNEKS